MKKSIKTAALLLAALLVLCSCGSEETPLRSRSLDADGYIAGVKALDYIDLCDISSITVKESDIQARIDDLLNAYPVKTQVYEKALEKGDTASINYTGYIDGVAFEGGTAENYEITVGETIFIDTFINDLIGMKPGEKRTITETFPNYYPANESLQGKEATFDVTLNHLIVKTPGELTDEYIAENMNNDYGWNSVADMRNGIIQDLSYIYITENSPISEIPQAVIDSQKDSLHAYYNSYAEYYEMELEEFLNQYLGITDIEQVLELSEAAIRQGAEQTMYFQAIAEKENLTNISREEIRNYCKEITGNSDFSSLRKIYGMPYLKQLVRTQKVFKLISERASIQ